MSIELTVSLLKKAAKNYFVERRIGDKDYNYPDSLLLSPSLATLNNPSKEFNIVRSGFAYSNKEIESENNKNSLEKALYEISEGEPTEKVFQDLPYGFVNYIQLNYDSLRKTTELRKIS